MASLFQEYKMPTTTRKVRNNRHVILEEIWDEIERHSDKKPSRRLFFIKTAKIADHKLLAMFKDAKRQTNFCQAFYGFTKHANRVIDGLIK